MAEPLLKVEGLRAVVSTRRGPITPVDGVDLEVGAGEAVALVGESGCGKTLTALSILRLLPDPPVRITGGRVAFEGDDLVSLPAERIRQVRGRRIAMIFQDPMTYLNPVLTIEHQIGESLRAHLDLDRRECRARVLQLLDKVQIPDPERIARSHPHQLSGGMRQRVLIATALSCQPRLIIADEPTTALDVTIQAQILELLRDLIRETGISLLLITHDLGVVAKLCDRVYVMYAGRIVEAADVETIFARPRHPYTAGLLRSTLRHDTYRGELIALEGTVPSLHDLPAGCRFQARCAQALPRCATAAPGWTTLAPGGGAACWLHA